MNIDEAKSKSYSMTLRVLHLAMNLLVGVNIGKLHNNNPSTLLYAVGMVGSIGLLVLSGFYLLYNRCRSAYSRNEFMIVAILCCLLSLTLIIIGGAYSTNMIDSPETSACGRFVMLQNICVAGVLVHIAIGKLNWAQRYSNFPSNLTWVFLFLFWGSSSAINITLGLLGCLLCLTTAGVNLWLYKNDKGTTAKRLLTYGWIGCMCGLALMQIVGAGVYFSKKQSEVLSDRCDFKQIEIFLAVNLVDALFWIFGVSGLGLNLLQDPEAASKDEPANQFEGEPLNENTSKPTPMLGTIY